MLIYREVVILIKTFSIKANIGYWYNCDEFSSGKLNDVISPYKVWPYLICRCDTVVTATMYGN